MFSAGSDDWIIDEDEGDVVCGHVQCPHYAFVTGIQVAGSECRAVGLDDQVPFTPELALVSIMSEMHAVTASNGTCHVVLNDIVAEHVEACARRVDPTRESEREHRLVRGYATRETDVV